MTTSVPILDIKSQVLEILKEMKPMSIALMQRKFRVTANEAEKILIEIGYLKK